MKSSQFFDKDTVTYVLVGAVAGSLLGYLLNRIGIDNIKKVAGARKTLNDLSATLGEFKNLMSK